MKLPETSQFNKDRFLQSLYDLVPLICRQVNRMSGQVFSATYDPPNLADGAGATTTIPAPGVKATVNYFVTPSFSLNTQGVILFAWVSADDVVSVRFQNESGGALDLASGTLKVRVSIE